MLLPDPGEVFWLFLLYVLIDTMKIEVNSSFLVQVIKLESCSLHCFDSEDQLKSDGVKVKRKQRNREKPPAQAPDPPRERVEVKKRTGFTPYRPPHMRTS